MLAWDPTDAQEEEFVRGPRGKLRGMGAVLVLGSTWLLLGPRELCWSDGSWCLSRLPPRPRLCPGLLPTAG